MSRINALPKEVLAVGELRAIFDTQNKFPNLTLDVGPLLYLLTHYSLGGGTIRERDEYMGEAKSPKLFNVRLIIETEEIIGDHTGGSHD